MIDRDLILDSNFTINDNRAMQNDKLSYRARGILADLSTRPQTWEVTLAGLSANSPNEGTQAVRTALKELEDAGYATQKPIRISSTGILKGRRWFISQRTEWIEWIKQYEVVPVVLVAGKYKLDIEFTEHAVNRRSVEPDFGSNGHNKEKNINKEIDKQILKGFLAEDSYEWKMVNWWKEFITNNDLIPVSVVKTGGITNKMLETWADIINKLHRIDGWDYEDISKVFKWLRDTQDATGYDGEPVSANFWFTKSKFYSLNKLRKSTRSKDKTVFGAMYDQMISDGKKKKKKSNTNFVRG